MLTFDASSLDITARAIERMGKQGRFVAAYALTKSMQDAREAEIGTMRSVFDRPTRYTLNALKVTPATKQNLSAQLGFKEFGGTPAWKYLGPQVVGGVRRHKSFEMLLIRKGIMLAGEFAVPSKRCPKDGYGNVSGGFITRMLSALGAQSDRYQNTKNFPKRSNRKRNLDFIVIRDHKRAPNGIYLQKEKWAVPILLFVKGVSYKKRFPYYDEARRIVPRSFRTHFRAGWQRFVVGELQRG